MLFLVTLGVPVKALNIYMKNSLLQYSIKKVYNSGR